MLLFPGMEDGRRIKVANLALWSINFYYNLPIHGLKAESNSILENMYITVHININYSILTAGVQLCRRNASYSTFLIM